MNALAVVKESDSGRAALVIVDEVLETAADEANTAPAGRWLREVVRSDEGMRPVVGPFSPVQSLVDDVDAAVAGHRQAPQLTWVTRSGDVVSRGTLRADRVLRIPSSRYARPTSTRVPRSRV